MKAKRNLAVYLVGGVVVVLLLMLFITQRTSAGVGPTLRSLLGYPPISATEDETGPNEMPTPSREEVLAMPGAPTLVPVEEAQRQQNETILAVLKELFGKAEAIYFAPGWWHIFSEREVFLTASETLANGEPIPMQATEESWTYVNNNGYIDKRYASQDTGDPLTSNYGVYKDGVDTNITLNESWEQPPYKAEVWASLMGDLGRDLDNIELTMKEASWEGIEVVIFSLTYRHELRDTNPENEKTPAEKEAVGLIGATTGTIYTYTISAEDGRPLVYEMSFIYPDGRVKLGSRVITRVFEKVEQPPDEILEYFK